MPKATLKAKKGHVYTFLLKFKQLDPYIQLRSVDIYDMKGIPASRYGSLLYAPYTANPRSNKMENRNFFVKKLVQFQNIAGQISNCFVGRISEICGEKKASVFLHY